jgi:hypothetical protein
MFAHYFKKMYIEIKNVDENKKFTNYIDVNNIIINSLKNQLINKNYSGGGSLLKNLDDNKTRILGNLQGICQGPDSEKKLKEIQSMILYMLYFINELEKLSSNTDLEKIKLQIAEMSGILDKYLLVL